jgi:hypothetical protein
MSSSRHRGTHSGSRKPARSAQAAAGLLIAVVVLASVAAVRALAFGPESPSATSFTGVVTSFADEGALMCVQRPGESDAPFCDAYFVAPDTPDIEVGDKVVVTTIASQDETGESVSGMLVQPAS